MRYRTAALDLFALCVTLCVAFNASRVGGKEILIAATLGTNSVGDTKCAWDPPQVCHEHHQPDTANADSSIPLAPHVESRQVVS